MKKYKTKIVKVIYTKDFSGRDRIQFKTVDDTKEGILDLKLEDLKEKENIELKAGDEIYLEDKKMVYKIIYQDKVIGLAVKKKKKYPTKKKAN